jgi:hypothetical protein
MSITQFHCNNMNKLPKEIIKLEICKYACSSDLTYLENFEKCEKWVTQDENVIYWLSQYTYKNEDNLDVLDWEIFKSPQIGKIYYSDNSSILVKFNYHYRTYITEHGEKYIAPPELEFDLLKSKKNK